MTFNSDYVQTNTFSPLSVTRSPVGLSSTQTVGIDINQEVGQNYSTNMLRRSYQSLEGGDYPLSNPPFNYGTAGKIPKSFSDNSPGDPRILRGYIRRAAPQPSDPTSNYRLSFMYNPATIQRQFVSYLEQAALDPFNSILNAGNLVAPPGILDFSFELFFDRQIENANGTFPRGVLVDYDYFDLVVRGVVPDPQSPALPDNGILMTNPRNITVVFSPQLAVTGRPDQASVVYEKFDHRMRPTRMRISLSMKAYSVGPVGRNFSFSTSTAEKNAAATIPYANADVKVQTLNTTNLENVVWYDTTYTPPKTPYTGESATSNTANTSTYSAPSSSAIILSGNTNQYPITSGYGPRGSGFHGGIDFGCPTGTPALAPVDGVIARTDYEAGGFGNYVVMITRDGLALIWGHLDYWRVYPGQNVLKGTVIGYTDNSGYSFGPHLHFEIREGSEAGASIDPTPYISSGWQVLG